MNTWGFSWGTPTSSWGDSWGEEEELEIGIELEPVARPVDFVIQSPLWRQGFMRLSSEETELHEMMNLYAMWKRGQYG